MQVLLWWFEARNVSSLAKNGTHSTEQHQIYRNEREYPQGIVKCCLKKKKKIVKVEKLQIDVKAKPGGQQVRDFKSQKAFLGKSFINNIGLECFFVAWTTQ